MKTNIIETKRLVLRDFIEKDIIYLKKILKDKDVMKFSIKGPCNDLEIESLFKTFIEDQKKYGFGAMAISLKDADKWIGFCGVFRGKINDFGYRLFKEYWNKGYATEAISACKNYLKKKFPDQSFYCYIDEENKASIKIAEKTKMKCLGQGNQPWPKCIKYYF